MPPPTPFPPTEPLAQQINIATRTTHATLNQRILSLLPLALPPHTQTATLYAKGVSHILPIYAAFEISFAKILALPPDLRTPTVDFLLQIHLPALQRTSRLQHDLTQLLPPPRPSEKTTPRTPPYPPCLTALLTHIHTIFPTRPHLFLAYTHIFYLALFSGGRYIRAKLRASQTIPDSALQFWHFDGKEDGEDLKAEFKRRFAVVGASLSEREREEVVLEAIFVMRITGEIVDEVAEVVGTTSKVKSVVGPELLSEKMLGGVRKGKEVLGEQSVRWMLLKHILPMGLVDLVLAAVAPVLGKVFLHWGGEQGMRMEKEALMQG